MTTSLFRDAAGTLSSGVRAALLLSLVLILAGCDARQGKPARSRLILWAWERPEDLRFHPDADIAIQTGFIEIRGDALKARGRYFPLRSTKRPSTALVHVQIDHSEPLRWSPALRAQLAAAIHFYATATPAPRVQLDFEVRKSERQILLQALTDLRRALPPKTELSITALASWCMDDDWLQSAPVDEIVPMLFRMQKDGPAIIKTLADGGDFRNPRCRAAVAISSDSPIARAQPGRRVYLFNPRSWTQQSFRRAQHVVEAWR
ncbi:hypothetical protein U1872_20910 [Sphingomonas sp. RB3P16]|uniref:hypothetical protein n=1 Tax=Parasphingomonas frigoris TaxID=3096163 RepID=UPI002FC6DC69